MKKNLLMIGLLAAASLLAQGPPPGRGGGMGPGGRMGPGGPGRGMMLPGMNRTVAGSPFSAVEVTETSQTLADGSTIRNRTQSNVYRDGSGRVRTESAMGQPASTGAQATRTIVNIHDPVAGVMRTLDPQNKTSREMAMPPAMGRGGNGGRGNRPFPPAGRGGARTDPNTVTENLAMQTINGVQATGTRVTRTIPAGQIGNSQPIQIVHETWTSVDLKVPVMVRFNDPRSGTTTTQLTNITRSEPDPSLFQAPSDYTVTREPGGRGMGRGMRGGR